MKDIEHEDTDEIVCPYCGYEEGGGQESVSENVVSGRKECGRCHRAFDWQADFTTTFYTTGDPEGGRGE